MNSLPQDENSTSALLFSRISFDFQRTIVKLSCQEDFLEQDQVSLTVVFEANIDPATRLPLRGLFKVPCQEGSDKFCW